MINKENGFRLNIRWHFPGGREYIFTFIALFAFLIIIYSNSFKGSWVFDDTSNILENRNIALRSLDWQNIKETFYGFEGKKLERPFAYLSFALNYYFGEYNVFGYHLVNFVIHYLSSVFLFLFIYRTLRLPVLEVKYGPASYSIALLASVFWATSPVQVTAVTYIVQRMASMAGLFYIMAMYFYLNGRTADRRWKQRLFWGLCLFSATLSLGTKENTVLLPFSIWLYDLLLIQGATRENVIRNMKVFAPILLVVGAVALWYVNIGNILSGAAYGNRPFTLAERLMTQPRIVVFYMAILLYPRDAWLTFIHDTELSTSLTSPWTTLPAMALILGLVALGVYLARKRPLISFSILFYFLNHALESTFIPLELIYEHRNYIPSMFFFIPPAMAMVFVIDYFSYKKTIQFAATALFTFLLFAQGHTVYARNALFVHPLGLWTDNVQKTPTLSRPYLNLGNVYWKLGDYDKAYELFTKAKSLNRYTCLNNMGYNHHNIGMYDLHVAGDYDGALSSFRAAIDTAPGLWRSYNGAAECYIRKGNMAEAGKWLSEALTIWPDNAQLLYTYSFVLLKLGKDAEAAKEARRALSLEPAQYNALGILGETFRRNGNVRMAVFHWERFVQKKPMDLEGHLALIELYSRQKSEDKLNRIIGKLMVRKGETSWEELIDQLLANENAASYIPKRDKIIAIIRNHLSEECADSSESAIK